jgi:amino acid adenylation domain-containing protein
MNSTPPTDQDKAQFWREQFAHGIFTAWPASLRPVSVATENKLQKLELPADLTVGKNAEFWLAVWALLLARYTGENFITFGVAQDGDLLPLSVAHDSKQSFQEWIEIVARSREQSQRGGPATPQEIRQWLGLAPTAHLFDSQVILDASAGTHVTARENPHVTLRVRNDSSALEWDPARIDNAAAARMAGHLEAIARAVNENPRRACGEALLLPSAEYQQVIVDWNSARADYAPDRAVHELIEDHALRTPEAIAATCDGRELTYGVMNRRADILARKLVALGVKPNTLVPICVPRSVDMMVGILGILKAGGAYVPIDPNYPADRRDFVLKDVASPLLVTEKGLVETLSSEDITLVLVDDDEAAPAAAMSPLPKVQTGNLAYAIYTSGSTGKPKGVLITHRNLVSSLAARVVFPAGVATNFLLLWSYAFDGSVAGIFWMLTTSGRLTMVPEGGQQDITLIANLIAREKADIIGCLPSIYAMLLDRWQTAPPPTLKSVIVAGEACPPKLVAQHQRQLPQTLLVNEYGPTEGTVWSTCYFCDRPVDGSGVPIGRPIPNAAVYLLDSNLQPVPVGIAGEICIGGDNLAQGYLNRPDLTAERFVRNPFRPGERLYLTGDYGRFLPDGNIEFLGRRDAQVKIRGFRVELGEIETVMARAEGVNECFVLVREDRPGDQRLVAYVTMKPGAEFSAPVLRHFVRMHLPEYMVPVAVVRMDKFPVSAVGKVDRKALPVPDPQAAAGNAPFHPPRNALESQIAELWQNELHLASVGIEDNFFDIGGHSLALMRIHQRLQKELGRDIPVTELFQHSTIRSLAERLNQKVTQTGLGTRAKARAQLLRAALTRKKDSSRPRSKPAK